MHPQKPDNSPVTVFASTNFRNQQRRFGIKEDDRRRHMYLVGKTGMGKSTTLENMIIEDIRAGRGLALVDPHGDLAEKVLKFIPASRTNDVVYFNPADTAYPVAFNILESVGEDYKPLVAYGLVGVFKKIWADSWGPRMEYILTNTILGLLDYPGSTLLGVLRMLVDKSYRKKVVAKIDDPVVKTFWSDEFANYSEKFRTEAIAPIQNKVGQFLASAIIRNIVGQSKSTIEMRDIMDNEKILIMNLAKGRIGEENSALLGAMMITKLQIAAMSRVDIPEEERKDFFLYVDEFQNFATDSFAGILSEARKYRLCLIMAHQYIEQLGDEVKAAVFGNVGTLIVFRVGANDALELEPEFAPQFTAQDILNLNKFTFCLRLMIDGIATEPFSAIGLPPLDVVEDNEEKIIKVSRERYARPRKVVEDRILRWSGVEIKREEKAEEKVEESTEDMDELDSYEDTAMPAMEPEKKLEDEVKEEPQPRPVEIEDSRTAYSGPVGPQNFIPEAAAPTIEPRLAQEQAFPVVSEAPAEQQPDETQIKEQAKPRINFAKMELPDEPEVTQEPKIVQEKEPQAKQDQKLVEDKPKNKKPEQKKTEPEKPKQQKQSQQEGRQPRKKEQKPEQKRQEQNQREDKKTGSQNNQSKPKKSQADKPKDQRDKSKQVDGKSSVEKDRRDDQKKVDQKAGDKLNKPEGQSISLSDLKDDKVEKVQFNGGSVKKDDDKKSEQKSDVTSVSEGGQKKKRKRKRKRKRQEGGLRTGKINVSGGQQQSSATAVDISGADTSSNNTQQRNRKSKADPSTKVDLGSLLGE